MEDSKLFLRVWRFNAIVIAVAGFLAIVALLFMLYVVFKETSRSRHGNEIVNIDPSTDIEQRFRLGNVEHVAGSQTVIVPLYSDQSYTVGFSSGKSTVSTRNLLFSNISEETNRWLLPKNDYLIASYNLINESNSYDSSEKVLTIMYNIIKNDTNNDSRLTDTDKATIALSKPDGSRYTEVLLDIDDVLGYDLIDKTTIAVLYTRNSLGYTAYILLSDFTVKKELALPGLGKD